MATNSGDVIVEAVKERGSEYESWMLVKRRSRCGQQTIRANDAAKSQKETLGSRFMVLNKVEEMNTILAFARGLSMKIVKHLKDRDFGGHKSRVVIRNQGDLGFIPGLGRSINSHIRS